MAKSENQKLKLIVLRDILLRKTDEEHPMSTKELIRELEKEGIKAERKSIYSDIEALEGLGLEVIKIPGRSNQYYVAEREFELPELKLLVDVVQAARFITEKKARELIKKLEKQTSEYAAKQLTRNVVIANRSKTSNENIYYNVDVIHRAIAENQQIQFYYYEWNVEKKFVPRKNGERYQVSPWALIWDDENYYLMAYDEKVELMKHYRVDKMKSIECVEEGRLGKDVMKNFDMGAFSKTTFGMYAGEEAIVSLWCKSSMVGVIIDRFGKDIMMKPLDNGNFEARIPVKVSSQFFGWLTALGTNVKVIGPERVKEDYYQYLKDIMNGME